MGPAQPHVPARLGQPEVGGNDGHDDGGDPAFVERVVVSEVGHHTLYNLCFWSPGTLVEVVLLFPDNPCQSAAGRLLVE